MGKINNIENGTSGADAATRINEPNEYDFVVTDSTSLAELATYTGGAYKNILIKPGSFTLPNGSNLSYSNIGFKKIVFMPGSEISGAYDGAIISGPTAEADRYDMLIVNPTISSESDVKSICVENCNNIYGGHVTFACYADTGASSCYKSCSNLYGTYGTISAFFISDGEEGSGSVFLSCTNIIYGKGDGLDSNPVGEEGRLCISCSNVVAPIWVPSEVVTSAFENTTGILAENIL